MVKPRFFKIRNLGTSKLKSEEELEDAVCGSRLIETTSLDNESGEPGDE